MTVGYADYLAGAHRARSVASTGGRSSAATTMPGSMSDLQNGPCCNFVDGSDEMWSSMEHTMARISEDFSGRHSCAYCG
eukprot:4428704-Pleurochrysis_carterae.AAC.1